MLYEPPRNIAKRLADLEGCRDGRPILRLAWDRRRCAFVVQRQAPTFRRGKGYVYVLTVGPRLRAGGPTELGSGDVLIRELRCRDDYATYGTDRKAFDKMWEREFEAHDRQVQRDEENEREDFAVELVHDMEDAVKLRHHVPPTDGTVRSFAKE